MTMITEPRTVFVKDVTLNYAKLVKPVNPFGTEQYELQIATTDSATAQTMRDLGLNVKEKDGSFTASLKRKARKANGDDNGRPVVIDAGLKPIDDNQLMKLGNGSVGNVKLYQYPYDAAGRKGTATSLTAVQVVDFVEYVGGGVEAGFSVVGDSLPAASEQDTVDEQAEPDMASMPF